MEVGIFTELKMFPIDIDNDHTIYNFVRSTNKTRAKPIMIYVHPRERERESESEWFID